MKNTHPCDGYFSWSWNWLGSATEIFLKENIIVAGTDAKKLPAEASFDANFCILHSNCPAPATALLTRNFYIFEGIYFML
jgi:hypothetical protein